MSKSRSDRAVKHYAETTYDRLLRKVEKKVGDQITSQDQLDKFGTKYIPGYQGAFARTPGLQRVDRLRTNQSLIINTTDAPGEHWVGVYKFPRGVILVYDSFGRGFDQLFADRGRAEGGRNRTKPRHALVDVEDDAEQGDEEMNCGARCLAWLLVCVREGPEVAWWV